MTRRLVTGSEKKGMSERHEHHTKQPRSATIPGLKGSASLSGVYSYKISRVELNIIYCLGNWI